MKNKKVLLLAGVMAVYLSGCGISSAATLSENMFVLAKNISVLSCSTDKAEILSALDQMDSAIDDSMLTLPEKVQSEYVNSVNDYKAHLEKMKAEIKSAREKANSGELNKIKDNVAEMHKLRIDGHNKFK